MQGKNWIRTQGGRLESTSSSSSRLRRPLFSEGPSFVSPPLNQEPSDNLPRLQYINPVFGSPSSSTSSAHSLTPHPSTSPTRSLPSSPFLEDPRSIPLIHQQSISSPSTSSPSVHMADEVENNQNQNNDIKDLLHHLVSGQAQMREDFQQMFQHLLARDNKPEGSNHEGPVGGNEENTTPISDFEKRMDKRMEQMEKAGTQIEDAIEVGIVKVEDFQRAKKFTPIGSSSKVQEIAVISKPNPIQLSFPKAPRQYNDLYMPPSKVFEKLIENDLLRPLDPTPLPARLPRTFDMAQRCDYHQGPGHSTDRCYALKNAIQDLIDNEIISPPTPPNRPNVNHNPLPNHHNQRPHINCIEDQEMGDPSLLIHKIPSCNMLSWDELMEDMPAKPKIDIWKDGKATKASTQTLASQAKADNPLEALSQQAPQPTLEDDLVLKQLQKTQANISLWSLLMASYSHRQAILKLLNQVQIPTDISPEALSAMIGTISQDTVIAFSDKDLPINGTNHNEALNITVDIGENRVPMVLIDNGSALNVCTLKTTICLGINRSEFLPSNQFVKAYDDTKREVHGVVILNISIGPMVQKVHFQVMDITASFNMLLGRPWLHETKAISSSLHQKVRFPYKGSIVTVHGDTQITPSKGPVLEIEPVDGDLVLSGFDFEEVHTLVLATETPEFFPIYYDPYSNDKVVTMIRGMGYFPGMGLGRKDQGIAEFQDYPKAIPTFGLGYKPTEEELLQKKERFLARIEAQNKGLPFDPIPMKPYTLTLNGKFVKEGEEHPYHGFPEPWKNKSTNQNMPGFEIFFNNQLDIEDLMQGIEKIEVKDWAEEMDGIAMEELLDGTVHMLGEKIDKDPSLLIGPTKDPLTNWVWGNGFANGDYKEEAKSTEFGPSLEFESVSRFNVKLSPVFDSESMSSDSESSSDNSSINEITDDSAYILSLNVLISQLMNNVIANNNEETPPTEERLVKPIKEEIESVNIGTNDEPKMMQIEVYPKEEP
ncbi:Retrovirus-related Pol polyprotein from transposon 17.6 [Fagus crenata]